VIVRRQLRRTQMLAFFKKHPPCLVGMEACATSQSLGAATDRTWP
jgi:transposase